VAPIAVFVDTLLRRREWPWLAVLALALAVLWVPRDLLPPRSMGTVQLPALIAIYLVALACLWPRHDAEIGPPAPTRAPISTWP